MLTVFVRHIFSCLEGDGTAKNRGLRAKNLSPEKLRLWRHCACPKYYTGTHNGQWFGRTSLEVTTWDAAERKLSAIIEALDGKPKAGAVALEDALDQWMTENRLSEMAPKSIDAFEHLAKIVRHFAFTERIHRVADFGADKVNQLRAQWATEPSPQKRRALLSRNTRKSRLARLHHFFAFAKRMGWIAANPVGQVKKQSRRKGHSSLPGDPVESATQPLDESGDVNYRRILAAVIPFFAGDLARDQGRTPQKRRAAMPTHPLNFQLLLELMYATGLRVSDACFFRPDRVQIDAEGWGVYTTAQTKTSGRVTVVLDPDLLGRIGTLPAIRAPYPFWDGVTPMVQWEVNQIGQYLREMAALLGLERLHAHQFRDSFAVNRLNENWTIERVSKALGHKSVAITEQYYGPWVKSREEHHIADWKNRAIAARAEVVSIASARDRRRA